MIMKRPAVKDKTVLEYFCYIEQKLEQYEKSPYAKTYLTILNQINSFNEQLTIGGTEQVETFDEEGEPTTVTRKKGFVDIFASKDLKEFDRLFKFMEKSVDLLKTLDTLREKMTPQEQSEERKLSSQATAEKYIFEDKK